MPDPKHTFTREPQKPKTLSEYQADVNAALKVFTPDSAEAIVGPKPPEEYGILIRGTRGVFTVMYEVLKRFGMGDDEDAREMVVKAMIMLLQIVNYAYALGLKRGREE